MNINGKCIVNKNLKEIQKIYSFVSSVRVYVIEVVNIVGYAIDVLVNLIIIVCGLIIVLAKQITNNFLLWSLVLLLILYSL